MCIFIASILHILLRKNSFFPASPFPVIYWFAQDSPRVCGNSVDVATDVMRQAEVVKYRNISSSDSTMSFVQKAAVNMGKLDSSSNNQKELLSLIFF